MRIIEVLSRFAAIIQRTNHWVKHAHAIEKRDGFVEKEELRRMMALWANEMFAHLQIRLTVKGAPFSKVPALLVGNHLSYLDMPLLMAVGPVRFIGKAQVAKWPVFGRACRTVGTVFVDRDQLKSRKEVALSIAPRIQKDGLWIGVFPAGTTTLDESKPWKWGAFNIAHEFKIPVQPFRIRYSPVRQAAFIGEDSFVPHLWRLIAHGGMEASVELHEPVFITDVKKQSEEWRQWARAGL